MSRAEETRDRLFYDAPDGGDALQKGLHKALFRHGGDPDLLKALLPGSSNVTFEHVEVLALVLRAEFDDGSMMRWPMLLGGPAGPLAPWLERRQP